MIVEPDIDNSCTFESIKAGECFIYGNDYYIKTNPVSVERGDYELIYNTVMLKSGEHCIFQWRDMVQSVKMKLVRIEE